MQFGENSIIRETQKQCSISILMSLLSAIGTYHISFSFLLLNSMVGLNVIAMGIGDRVLSDSENLSFTQNSEFLRERSQFTQKF